MNHDDRLSANERSSASSVALAQHIAGLWSDLLGTRLAGVYLIGSLAHGGYSAIHSDIDVALIHEGPLTTAELDFVKARMEAHSPNLAHKISLFWADEMFSTGRFPLLDRIDYLDHRLKLIEHRRVLPNRPTLREVRVHLSADPLRKWSDEVTRLNALTELSSQDRKCYLRTILYPARFLYSWHTGGIASNDDAVAYVLERKLVGSEGGLLIGALRCRNATEDISGLFPERRRLHGLVRFCTSYATSL